MSTDSERNALWIGGGKQLLVVDSDQEERDRLVRFLQKAGFNVFGVDTFDEAIAYMETRGVPHLVLMTMSSAGIDEFRRGQALSRNGDIPDWTVSPYLSI